MMVEICLVGIVIRTLDMANLTIVYLCIRVILVDTGFHADIVPVVVNIEYKGVALGLGIWTLSFLYCTYRCRFLIYHLLPYVFADFDGRVSLTVPNDVWTRVVVIVALVAVYTKFPIIAAILAVLLGNILFIFTIFKALVYWSLAKCGYPMFRFLV